MEKKQYRKIEKIIRRAKLAGKEIEKTKMNFDFTI